MMCVCSEGSALFSYFILRYTPPTNVSIDKILKKNQKQAVAVIVVVVVVVIVDSRR